METRPDDLAADAGGKLLGSSLAPASSPALAPMVFDIVQDRNSDTDLEVRRTIQTEFFFFFRLFAYYVLVNFSGIPVCGLH